MAEAITRSLPQVAENLTLRPQVPMVIPKEIRDLRLTGQLPRGDIAYFDLTEPDTYRLIDQETWKPVIKKGVEVRHHMNGGKHRLAGIILHVPERTSDSSFDDTVDSLSKMLKRTATKEEGIITSQNLGALFIVEDKGEDQRVGWRQEQLARAGLVVDASHNGSVIVSGDHVISFARRPKQRSAVDLTQGEKSRYMVGPFIDSIENRAAMSGYSADTSVLRAEARATRNPPGTIADLRDGGGVIYETMDSDGKRIVVDRTGNSETVTPSRDALQGLVSSNGHDKNHASGEVKQLKHKDGDVEQLEACCGDCGRHFEKRYFEIPGDYRSLLFSETGCPDHGVIERRHYEGALGMLPPSMRKNSPSRAKANGSHSNGNGK